MTTTYTGECPKCGHEQTREWKGEPWRGPDGETSFAADCHKCGPGVEVMMSPDEGEIDLRLRIDEGAIVSSTFDGGEYDVVASYDGVTSSLSVFEVSPDEATRLALCGLRLDYVRREVGRGTATAADVRVAIEDATVLGHGDDDVSDLIEAFLLLASGDELDDWREEKVRRLADEMDEDDLVEVWSLEESSRGKTMFVERSSRWKVNEAASHVGALSPTGGPGGTPELERAIPLAEYMARFEGKRP